MRKFDSSTLSLIIAAVLAATVGLVVQFTSAKRSLERANGMASAGTGSLEGSRGT